MKKIFMFSIVFVFGLLLAGLAMAAETTGGDIVPPDTLMPGMIESTGTLFEINNSDYLNIILDSSEPITLRLESIPEMVTMYVEPASDAASTQITVNGFQPSTAYYKYEDNYHNLVEFTTDRNGSYSWTQDLSQSHLVFIQPRKSTKFIADNATGGDCNQIGNWVWTTKTCTLTTDVNETIQIDSNYITLDGNGHAVTGTGTGYGVYLYRRTGVAIKNLNVKNFGYGIYLLYSSNNTLTGNIASNNSPGIGLWYSSNNTLTNNTALNAGYGILLFVSRNNTLTGNTASNNDYGILLTSYTAPDNNTLTGNTASNNHWGIVLAPSNNNTLTGNTTSNNRLGGIYLENSSNNTLTSNIASNNLWDGFSLGGGWNNILTDNTALNNNSAGIALYSSSNNALTDNTASNNSSGIRLYYSSNNQIYKNNFISNATQAFVYAGSGNIFNLEKPTGGNYWSDFDTPGEGCYDTNSDGFCDAPYRFYDGVDYLPWAKQSGWEVPADTTPPTTTATLSGTSGNNGWYISNVQLTLTAVDNTDGSGVKEIHYSIDGGAETVASGSSAFVTINTDGTHTLTYYAVDNATNTETAYALTIKIDKTLAIITILGVNDGATYALGLVPKASYIATDAISGIATISDSLTGGDSFGMGTFTYNVTAKDNAGNIATQTVTYTVIATIDGLTELINQFLISGAVDNTGIANSLLSKINNALTAESSGNGQASDNIMQAFINQISAQAGQHISQNAAAILINAATYIIYN